MDAASLAASEELASLAAHLEGARLGEGLSVTVVRAAESHVLGGPVELVTAFLSAGSAATELALRLAAWRQRRTSTGHRSDHVRFRVGEQTLTLEQVIQLLERTAGSEPPARGDDGPRDPS